MRKLAISAILASIVLGLFSCSSEEDKPLQEIGTVAASQNPFEFYKKVEIRPGISFEALSWGRGVDTLGGFTFLMADSVHHLYKTVGGTRKGKVVGFWNLDLDNDGNPELYLQTVNNQQLNDLMVYEFEGNDFKKINFPALSSRTKDRINGADQFFVKGGELFRTLAVKAEKDVKADTLMTVQYLIKDNTFSIKDVK